MERTTEVGGKPINRRLNATEASLCRESTNNGRRLRAPIDELTPLPSTPLTSLLENIPRA
jgi:hypothetical protein